MVQNIVFHYFNQHDKTIIKYNWILMHSNLER